jgi:hypothetical protein
MAQGKSLVELVYAALGLKYAILLPLSALVSFVLVLGIIVKGKGPTVGPALVLTSLLPLFVGLLATTGGFVDSLLVLQVAANPPPAAEMLVGFAGSAVPIWTALVLGAPGYLTAVVGGCIRAFRTAA